MADAAASSGPRAASGVEWLMMQAARSESRRPADQRSREFKPIMEQIAARTSTQPVEDDAEAWQVEAHEKRVENMSPATFNPTRLLSFVAGRPIGVASGVANVG